MCIRDRYFSHITVVEKIFSRTNGPIFTKFDTKNSWIKRILVYPYEGPPLFSEGCYNEKAKIN